MLNMLKLGLAGSSGEFVSLNARLLVNRGHCCANRSTQVFAMEIICALQVGGSGTLLGYV